MKNTDIIITNCALIKQKKAKITCLCDFCFLLFAIKRRLRSHFKNSCFMFYRGFQRLENNKSPWPNGLGLSSVNSCLETSVKHSHSFLKYYLKNAWLPPIFFLDFNNTWEDLPFLHNHKLGQKYL